MYVSMGHVMWGWPLPSLTPLSIALFELLITGLVMVIHQRFFVSGFRKKAELKKTKGRKAA